MKFDEFIASILEALKIRLLENGEEVVLRTNKVLKNNGVELTALNVCRDADEVSPTIYLEPFYRAYMNGMSYEDVLDDIYRLQLMRSFENALSIDAVVNEEHVLDNIIIRLINRKRNEKMLEDIPYIEVKDLVIVFRRVVRLDSDGVATTLVNRQDMNRWRLTVDSLYKKALDNTERMFPVVKESIFETLRSRFDNYEICNTDMDDELFILTNEMGINGATAMMYSGMLDECADMAGGDIYILPSSVHEILFTRVTLERDENDLKELIKEANRDAVSELDFLSDNLYLYKKADKELCIV